MLSGTGNGDCPNPNLIIFFPCFSKLFEISFIFNVADKSRFFILFFIIKFLIALNFYTALVHLGLLKLEYF